MVIDFTSVRTDNQIAEQLKYSVQDDPVFIGLDLAPSVKDGIVSWNGQVGSEGEFNRIVRKSFVTGVTDVETSELTVNGDLTMEGIEDKEYSPRQKIEALDAALAETGEADIDTSLNNGIVILSGEVGNS